MTHETAGEVEQRQVILRGRSKRTRTPTSGGLKEEDQSGGGEMSSV